MKNKKMNNNYDFILDYIDTLKIIDTHEHLPSKEEDRDSNGDVLNEYLCHYTGSDLKTAGLDNNDYKKILENDLSITKKWKIIEPYWEFSRFTGYGRALTIAVKDIYGIDKIDSSTIEGLNKKFLENLKPGYFKKVLKNKCKIVTSLLNVDTLDKEYNPKIERSIYCDKDLYTPVYGIRDIINPNFWSQIEKVEKQSGIRITSFSKWLDAAEKMIEKAYSMGAIALKHQLAYQRTLKYERVIKSRAEEEFSNIFKTKYIPEDWNYEKPLITGKAFQDYMFHFILDIANKNNLILQIHTGMQEGNGNILSNSHPGLLTNLFLEYPDITFDIFHISYPYQNELAVLAKNFPNVYIDMCWSHIISPNASVNSLLEFIDTVPLNKLSAFGGDYTFVDGVYGHLQLAKKNVARALSIKVNEGLFDLDKAMEIAKMLFYKNPLKIFRLEKSIV